MNISINQNQNTFGATFINTKSFREVAHYAEKNGKLLELDTALYRLSKANKGDILLIHGKTPNGRVFSNFNMGKRAIQNLGAKTPEEASFNAICELGELGRKFKRLIGGEVKTELNVNDVILKHSKINI